MTCEKERPEFTVKNIGEIFSTLTDKHCSNHRVYEYLLPVGYNRNPFFARLKVDNESICHKWISVPTTFDCEIVYLVTNDSETRMICPCKIGKHVKLVHQQLDHIAYLKLSILAILVYRTKVVRVDWLGNLANYKEDYNVSLFDVVCTVTVFCSRCDASLVYRPFAYLHLKAFCYFARSTSYFKRGKENKNI